MSKTNTISRDTLIFFARPAATAPTRPTSPIYLALCESDPGETGDMATAEIAAGRLATHRVAITFDDPTNASPSVTQNTALVSHGPFLQGATITHFAICKSNVRGTNDAIYHAPRNGGSVAMGTDETLNSAAGAVIITET